MKKLLFLTAFIISTISYSQYQFSEGFIELLPGEQVNKKFIHHKLILYPILGGTEYLAMHKNTGHYLTLEEALEQKKVIITEAIDTNVPRARIHEGELNAPAYHEINQFENNAVNPEASINQEAGYNQEAQNNMEQVQQRSYTSGGTVNTLYIENVSSDTVFIMAGEIIKGGKQDRVIGNDMILSPNSGKINLSVFCVEQSRWRYDSANAGQQFNKYYSVSSNSIRKKASVSQNQQEVWDEVNKVTTKQNAQSETKSYTALENSSSYKTDLNKYLDFYLQAFSGMKNCIGFVGVTGDSIIGCDIFASPLMFEKQLKNLLNAYITEALTHGSEATFNYKKTEQYLMDIFKDPTSSKKNIEEKGYLFEQHEKILHINTY